MTDMMLAICKAYCDRCHQDDWLYANDSKDYGLLCEDCMNEIDAKAKETEDTWNGKEIYEGDLLLYPNGEIIKVIWMCNPAAFSPKEIDILHAPVIIGNIYENPELIQERS